MAARFDPESECREPRAGFAPAIDRHACEGKEACARVCPYGVFEVRKLAREEKAALPLFVRLKVLAHGGKQAFATLADECRACGLCVEACPEDAITLVPVR